EAPAPRKDFPDQLHALLASNGELSSAPTPDTKDLQPNVAGAVQWSEKLRFARWKNKADDIQQLFAQLPDLAQLDGVTAGMAIEEYVKAGNAEGAVAIWLKLSDKVRDNYAARTYARYAAGALMDKARAAKDLKALFEHFTELLTTNPARNYVERW